MPHAFLPRQMPEALQGLIDLALDLRWTWCHASDALWKMLYPEIWEQTRNPWVLLHYVSQERLEQVTHEAQFMDELQRLVADRTHYLQTHGWYQQAYGHTALKRVAYFSMEVGLGNGLPLYAGGLGLLTGDYLKAASDLGVPVVGISLLYQQGYFRQVLDADGTQLAFSPYNEPTALPIQPVLSPSGGWLHVPLAFPGRTLFLRLWQVRVGSVSLYLLDSNDPLNSPADRGITSELYGGSLELRLMQDIVLGIGGWLALEALGLQVDICHLNEGHAALAVLARARHFLQQHRVSFWEAWWATRAGNVFTTHTPVAAGFDTFPIALLAKYLPHAQGYAEQLGLPLAELLALGRCHPNDGQEPFNMAYLAMRGCGIAHGVSRLHGMVSRRIFQPLYPHWPQHEVPVGHITNGVHAPSWDSPWADTLWTEACGKARWGSSVVPLAESIQGLSDAALWQFRAAERLDLVRYARQRLARQLGQRGAPPQSIEQAARVLDPNILTLGLARRFATYKRPNLLLHDPERLLRLLNDRERPVQIIVAGKAHPHDEEGKQLVRTWALFVQQAAAHNRAVFLEDYDIALAQELVQGVDVWINTPRRPWEACGTSGMKVLVNGGLNLSELDGWWAEAYTPEVGWALGDGQEHTEPGWDDVEAEQLYTLLEQHIVPEFYHRDAQGIPRQWVARMRASMSRLAPQFSSNRMLCDYIERLYLPAAQAVQRRSAQAGQLAKSLYAWHQELQAHWQEIHWGSLDVEQEGEHWVFRIQVFLGGVNAKWVRVELYADPLQGDTPLRIEMQRVEALAGAIHGYAYQASVPASRPSWHFTPRLIPYHPEVAVPLEASQILWQR